MNRIESLAKIVSEILDETYRCSSELLKSDFNTNKTCNSKCQECWQRAITEYLNGREKK